MQALALPPQSFLEGNGRVCDALARRGEQDLLLAGCDVVTPKDAREAAPACGRSKEGQGLAVGGEPEQLGRGRARPGKPCDVLDRDSAHGGKDTAPHARQGAFDLAR